MHSTVLAELLSFGENVYQICYLLGELLAMFFTTECVQTREMPYKLPKIRLSLWTL